MVATASAGAPDGPAEKKSEESDRGQIALDQARQALESIRETQTSLSTLMQTTETTLSRTTSASADIDTQWQAFKDRFDKVINANLRDLQRAMGAASSPYDALFPQPSQPTHSKIEHFDSADILKDKVSEMVKRFRRAKHAIAFTGAGISTAAGIPDYRSGANTVLDTGAGLWTKAAHKKQVKMGRDAGALKKPVKTVLMHKACPTYTHMALQTLVQKGMLKFLISQNIDGLHLRSDVPRSHLSELHGNRNLEQCVKCKTEYLRDHRVRTSKKVHDHFTGRTCDDPKCSGALQDTIINFGESLPERDWSAASIHAGKADFCLAVGSSLTVTPAANLPEEVGDRKDSDLFIVNLQNTPLDRCATLRLNGKCDEVMKLFMLELGIEVLPWKLQKGIRIDVLEVGSALAAATSATPGKDNLLVQRTRKPLLRPSADKHLRAAKTRPASSDGRKTSTKKTFEVYISGINVESRTPYSQFTVVELFPFANAGTATASSSSQSQLRGSSPLASRVQSKRLSENESSVKFAVTMHSAAEMESYTVKCAFHGHYQEPVLEMPCVPGIYKVELDEGKWAITPLQR